MADIVPLDSVLRGYSQLLFLLGIVRRTIHDYEPNLYEFRSFKEEVVLLHRGILSLLRTIHGPIPRFEALGLRTTEESWLEPPPDSYAAMQEVESLIHCIEPLINLRNRFLSVSDYDSLFNVGINSLTDRIEEFYEFHPPEGYNTSAQMSVDDTPGATEEQINAIPVHIATTEDVDQICSICVSNFVAEEKIKVLHCSHRFHKRCIDSWLRERATCPMDRSRVFRN